MYKLLPLLLLLLLTGCATTQATVNSLNIKYRGKNIDKFTINNGPPYGKHRLRNGGYVYKWRSARKSFYLPTTTSTTGSASVYGYGNYAYGNYSGRSVTYGGGSITLGCVLQLYTNNKGYIRHITALDDSAGVWKASRCAEVVK